MTWRASADTPAWIENRRVIVAAAARVVRRVGFLRLRIDDVAAATPCSRASLYRYFRDKDALVRAVLAHQAAGLADRLAGSLARIRDPADAIVEGILQTVEAIRKLNWFRSRTDTDAARIARLAGGPQALAASLAPLTTPLLHKRLRADIPPAEAAEWLLLVVIGLLAMNLPVRRTRAEQAAYLRRFVAAPIVPDRRRR